VTDSDKQSIFLLYGINYGRRKFFSTGSQSSLVFVKLKSIALFFNTKLPLAQFSNLILTFAEKEQIKIIIQRTENSAVKFSVN
jgi:hypothetical protein